MVGLDSGKESVQNNVAWGIILEGHVNEDRLVERSHAVCILIKNRPHARPLAQGRKGVTERLEMKPPPPA